MTLLSDLGQASAVGGGVESVSASRTLTAADNGKLFVNRGATNVVLTWPVGITDSTFSIAGEQSSTGTIQIIGATGVTMIGSANITALQGQFVFANYGGVDTFNVKVG